MALEANTSQFQYKYIEKITESACGAENPQGINGYVFIYVMCMYYVYIYIYINHDETFKMQLILIFANLRTD